MKNLLEQTFERTLNAWVREWVSSPARPRTLQAWLFEGTAARRAAERRLREAGIGATLRSSYKPLLHHFLEEVERPGLARVRVRYPVHPHAAPLRFRLEAYPLHELLPGVDLQWEARALADTDTQPFYEVELAWNDGHTRTDSVFAPSRMHQSPLGQPMLSPTAWRKETAADGGLADAAHPSDYADLFAAAMDCVRHQPWPATEPYFERLRIDAALPGPASADGGNHLADLHEALHEDLYFSLLEFFQQHSGRPQGDRRLQPGQIAPFVRRSDGAVSLRVALESPLAAPHAPEAGERTPLAAVQAPLSLLRVEEELRGIQGRRFEAPTRQGRRTAAVYRAGPGPSVLLSGGQHANETSGVVGALRAAEHLQGRPDAHFAVLPLENPDGYALHAELCTIAPTQMHHAARYSAMGDDIEYRDKPPLLERAAREWALATSGAALHVNLHGYPAHEWTRPHNGYIPQGFELWTIPKGFFLIMRHRAGWQERAQALLEAVCLRLAQEPELMAFNAAQLAAYKLYREGPLPFGELRGTVYTLQEVSAGPPLTFITEFPDQTLQGPAFAFAHRMQMLAALAAVEAFRR